MSTASQSVTSLSDSSQPNSTTFATLTVRDLGIFRALKVPDDAIAAAGIERVNDRDARERFGIRGWKTSDMSGLIFPYLAPETGNRSTCRLRRDNPEVDADGKSKGKYMTPAGDPRRLYYPPTVTLARLEDRTIPIIIVEAEKSALAMMAFSARTKRNILALATGGCWGWMGRIGKRRNEYGKNVDVRDALFDFHYLTGRVVYVLLDANVATNPEVQAAEKTLIKKLRKWEVSRIHVCRLPVVDSVNGPDDYLGKFGDDAMMAVIDFEARPIYKRNVAISASATGAAPIERLPEDTEIKMAHRFVQNAGGDLRYIPQLGSWRVWDGSRWREDDICEVWTRVHDYCAEASSRMLDRPGTCCHIASASTVAAIERISRWNPAAKLSAELWDADACLLNASGKTVEMEGKSDGND
jgi:hypothetical protein